MVSVIPHYPKVEEVVIPSCCNRVARECRLAAALIFRRLFIAGLDGSATQLQLPCFYRLQRCNSISLFQGFVQKRAYTVEAAQDTPQNRRRGPCFEATDVMCVLESSGLFRCDYELNAECDKHLHHSADSWVALAG